MQRAKALTAHGTQLLPSASLAKLVGAVSQLAAPCSMLRAMMHPAPRYSMRVRCPAGPGLGDMAEACSADPSCLAFATNGNMKVGVWLLWMLGWCLAAYHSNSLSQNSISLKQHLHFCARHAAGCSAISWRQLGCLPKCKGVRWRMGQNSTTRCGRPFKRFGNSLRTDSN